MRDTVVWLLAFTLAAGVAIGAYLVALEIGRWWL